MSPKEIRAIPYFCFWFSISNSLSVPVKKGSRVLFLLWFKQSFAHTHMWDRRELEKKWHFMGWDKGSSMEQKIITMIKKYTKWGMCNQLLITRWRMCGHPWTVGCDPQPTPPALYAERGTIGCRMSLYPAEISCPGSGWVPSSLVTARAEKPLT